MSRPDKIALDPREIREMAARGDSVMEMAEAFGVNHATVCRAMRDQGIEAQRKRWRTNFKAFERHVLEGPVNGEVIESLLHIIENLMAPPLDDTLDGLGLTPKERALVECLLTSPGSVRSKAQILDALYFGADEEPDAHIVAIFVCKARPKVAGVVDIKTHFARGFSARLIGEAPQ